MTQSGKPSPAGVEQRKTERPARLWEKGAAILFLLVLWQIGAMALNNRLLLVTPLDVAIRLSTLCLEPDFLLAVSNSVVRIFSGYLVAMAAGTMLAAIAARLRLAEILLWPVMASVKSIPVASFIILCLIWLTSDRLSIFISFLMVLPIVYTHMLHGIQTTDRMLLEMASLFRVRWGDRLTFIHLPHLKPFFYSASSVSIGLAWKAGIAAEVIGIPAGSIGEKLYEAKVYFLSADLFSWTVVIVAVSIAFEKGFLLLIRQLYRGMERTR
jgi:NitT/TauT family transport system permease protein